MKTLLHHFLEHSAVQYPDNIAIIQDDQRYSYQQVNRDANHLAGCLQSHGIKMGDRIVLLLENCVDYIIGYYAALKLGAVAAPLNPGIKPDGLKYLLDDLAPTALITSFKSERLLKATSITSEFLKLIIIKTPKQKWNDDKIATLSFEESITPPKNGLIPPSIEPEALANIIYTSGSTGAPRGVMLSHRNIVSNTLAICQYLSLSQKDIQMVVLPFFYVMGKSLLNTHMAVGGTVVLNNRFLYPADVLKQMVTEKVTGFSGVPSTYAYLLNRSPLASYQDQLSALRYCTQAGGHMALSTKRELRRVLPEHTQIYIMYGATEASARLTYLEPSDFHLKCESIGKPLDNVTIRILDENGHELPNGEVGELVAAGPNIMLGYWNNPTATDSVLGPEGYHTGDLGFCDSNGNLFVKYRKDGLIKVGGHRVNPTEVEDLLIASGNLIESAVVGVADKLLGHKLVALIVPNSDQCRVEDILKTCADQLPKHKWPSVILPVRVLPKNANGKIDREKCLEIALSQAKSK